VRKLLIVTLLILSVPALAATSKAKLPKPRKVAQASSTKVESEFEPKDYDEEIEADDEEEQVIDDEPDEAELTPATPPPTKNVDVTPEQPARPSSASGQKIFDWSKHQDKREVPHPFAEKGLTRITKEGDYLYKVDESNQRRASAFKIGIFNPTNLENPDQAGQVGATFEENYDQTNNPAIMFDYEWQLWRMKIGKLGVKAGTGLYVAQGNGHFVSTTNQGLVPREIFTFWAMPNSIGAVYRMQFTDKQLLVPYGEGGGIVFAFGEFRDDDKPPKWGGALAAYFAGGLAFNLSYFDALSRAQLDREYGINRVYLTAEFRQIIAITQTYDFTSDLVNAGFLMEF
jgi:hypothetical protein